MAYRCNFCGQNAYETLYEQLNIVRCKQCGLTSLLVIPGPDDLQALYDKEYSAGESFNRFYTHFSTARKIEAFLRMRALRGLSGGRSLLDVGAGMGYYVEAALKQGWNACGVEISHTAIAQADRRLPIYSCAYELFEPGQLYDVITLWAMIEHAAAPRAVLEKSHALLKPNGYIVLETGDIASPDAERDGAAWRMFHIAGHLYFFSSACLDWVLRDIGFTVLRTDLDKWIEHTLMQSQSEGSLLIANKLLPGWLVATVARSKYYVNRAVGRVRRGDVMIKIAQKTQPAARPQQARKDYA